MMDLLCNVLENQSKLDKGFEYVVAKIETIEQVIMDILKKPDKISKTIFCDSLATAPSLSSVLSESTEQQFEPINSIEQLNEFEENLKNDEIKSALVSLMLNNYQKIKRISVLN